MRIRRTTKKKNSKYVHGRLTAMLAVPVAVLLTIGVLRADDPRSMVNPITGFLETVDEVQTSGNADVRHIVEKSQHSRTETILTSHSADDRDPRLTISSVTGDTWVVWWRDLTSDEVLVQKREISGLWSSEVLVSKPQENAANPEITFFDGWAWAVYEAAQGSETGIIAGVITDEPDPFGMVPIGASRFQGNVDALIESSESSLWASWIDVGQVVVWREYLGGGVWSSPQLRSYAESCVETVRDEIQDIVTGDGLD